MLELGERIISWERLDDSKGMILSGTLMETEASFSSVISTFTSLRILLFAITRLYQRFSFILLWPDYARGSLYPLFILTNCVLVDTHY